MRILHVITGMQKAAGTTVFCGELANELVAAGHSVTIATVNGVSEYRLDKKVRVSSISSVIAAVDGGWDIVHIHALWSPVLHKVSQWAHRNDFKVVWSPHGMLTPWALRNRWWKKFSGLVLYQYWDLRKAALLHVTAPSEVDDVRRLGLKTKNVVAPLGIRIDGKASMETAGNQEKKPNHQRTLLFVSRVQRKKGLPNLIAAWNMLRPEGWRAVIAGPDEGNHIAELKALMKDTAAERDFEFVGPVFGAEKDNLYGSADLFVLPTHSENFGVVVIEALAHGVPVITTKGTPWGELPECKCGWWIDIGAEPLADALREAMALSDDERAAMGGNGRKLVSAKYTWAAVTEKMLEGYNTALGQG